MNITTGSISVVEILKTLFHLMMGIRLYSRFVHLVLELIETVGFIILVK